MINPMDKDRPMTGPTLEDMQKESSRVAKLITDKMATKPSHTAIEEALRTAWAHGAHYGYRSGHKAGYAEGVVTVWINETDPTNQPKETNK